MSIRKPPRNLLTLSRIELYDLIWSWPLSDIAREFDLSEAELRPRCVDLHVPPPDDADAGRTARGENPNRAPLRSPPLPAEDPSPRDSHTGYEHGGGRWARVHAGQRPPKRRLKALKPELMDASRLRFGTPSPERQANSTPKPCRHHPSERRSTTDWTPSACNPTTHTRRPDGQKNCVTPPACRFSRPRPAGPNIATADC